MPQLRPLPEDIPSKPARTFAGKGWENWGDWLGTGATATYHRKYRSFRDARKFVHKLKLTSVTEWYAFCKGEMPHRRRLPADIPTSPRHSYGNRVFKGYGDWLGTGRIADQFKKYRPFPKARAFARNLKLKSSTEWFSYVQGRMPRLGRLPTDIPALPRQTYVDKGWKGFGDWLGTGRTRGGKRPFKKARAFARKLKLKTNAEWIAFTQGRMRRLGKLPADIPAYPNQTYADKGWKGVDDWLGTGRKPTNQRRKQ